MSEMRPLDGQIALITGASRGLGRAVALGLAERGVHIVALARTVSLLEDLDDEIKARTGGEATLVAQDLTQHDALDRLGFALAERFGKLDMFFGNAAMIGTLGTVYDIEPKDWSRIMKVNFMANVRLVRALDPLLVQAPAGRVIFSTCSQAQDDTPFWGAYGASKAALEHFAGTYARECKARGIAVACVDPGVMDTKLLAGAFPGGYQGDMNKPEDAAKRIISLFENGFLDQVLAA